MTGTLYVGTSGFAYPEWRGSFYPDGLKQASFLEHYAGRFAAVEINYTFRRFPAETTMDRWAARAPDGFRFAMKANRRITHTRRLHGADRDVSEFLDRARRLGERLGPILFQCPPSLQFDRELIESFLAYLPPVAPYAFEFRHESWNEARPILAEHGVAWCVSETEERAVDDVPTEPFVYLRLRKEDYTDDDLKRWADTVRSATDTGRDVFAFFKHEDGTAAPVYAERLSTLAAA
ncbi:MAG TPA: DUF72 domain-containing protein [Actinomycetota bacterium]|nr:DUF72 domain-containing protein [Actinomycetota bacterium]